MIAHGRQMTTLAENATPAGAAERPPLGGCCAVYSGDQFHSPRRPCADGECQAYFWSAISPSGGTRSAGNRPFRLPSGLSRRSHNWSATDRHDTPSVESPTCHHTGTSSRPSQAAACFGLGGASFCLWTSASAGTLRISSAVAGQSSVRRDEPDGAGAASGTEMGLYLDANRAESLSRQTPVTLVWQVRQIRQVRGGRRPV